MCRRPLTLGLLVAVVLGVYGQALWATSRDQVAGAAPEADACAEGPIFRDRAAETGLDFTHWNGMTGAHYLPEITGSGVAFVDYDGDGDLDVYLVQMMLLDPGATTKEALVQPPGDLPLSDRLFRNDRRRLPDGTVESRFTDVTAAAGLDGTTGYGMGVATGDLTNDGRPDLYLTNLGPNQLWINRPDGRFEEAEATAGADDRGWSVPATPFDLDRDGRLDLFVGRYVDFTLGRHRVCRTATGAPDWCGPLSYSPTSDRLFRNVGTADEARFREITRSAGLAEAEGAALGSLAADLDGDGWLDLYVANDQMENFLWMNRPDRADASDRSDGHGRTFVDEAPLAGAAVSGAGRPQASMGVDAADVDGDGDLDLFMTHLTDEPNTLYLNDGRGNFVDGSRPSGLGMASWQMTGFGTAFLDYDNDSRLDLLAVNGAVRSIPEQTGAGEHYPLRQPNQLFRNLGAGRFEEVTSRAGDIFGVEEVSRGAAFGDVDGDGDGDVTVNTSNGPARLLVNDCGHHNRWIGFEVVDRHGRAALGAVVTVELADGSRLTRRVHTDGSFASSNDPRVVFGLEGRAEPTAVSVRWIEGGRSRFDAPSVGRYARLRPGR